MLINHYRSASAASGLITSIKASISILAPSSQPAVVRRDGQKHHPNDQNEPSLTIAPRNGKSFSIFLERVQWNVVRLLTDALATVRIRPVNFCLWGSLSNHQRLPCCPASFFTPVVIEILSPKKSTTTVRPESQNHVIMFQSVLFPPLALTAAEGHYWLMEGEFPGSSRILLKLL